MTHDIFDNKILCKKCDSKMQKGIFSKNGYNLRAVVCPNCKEKIVHPADEAEYNKFIDLKNKEFEVKMRLVGNSYAVSIPKEIVNFMNEQTKVMDEMVKLCFEDMGRVSLSFNVPESESQEKENVENTRVIKTKEVRVVKNGKPVLHAKQFLDSAHPERNKSFILKKNSKKMGEELGR